MLRTARGLLQQGVPFQRVRRALRELRRQIPPGRPLSSLRITADGKDVVVRDGRFAWRPESGQAVFLFDAQELARSTSRLARSSGPRAHEHIGLAQEDLSAHAWFEKALSIEDDDPEQARVWYQRALDQAPDLVDAYVNLGRLIHEAGDPLGAVRLYREAIRRAPNDAFAHYNLALALEDRRRLKGAVRHYREAIRIEPGFADAHFSLARLLERMGCKAQASWHFLVYSKLTSVK